MYNAITIELTSVLWFHGLIHHVNPLFCALSRIWKMLPSSMKQGKCCFPQFIKTNDFLRAGMPKMFHSGNASWWFNIVVGNKPFVCILFFDGNYARLSWKLPLFLVDNRNNLLKWENPPHCLLLLLKRERILSDGREEDICWRVGGWWVVLTAHPSRQTWKLGFANINLAQRAFIRTGFHVHFVE